jgi:hypothetical protein
MAILPRLYQIYFRTTDAATEIMTIYQQRQPLETAPLPLMVRQRTSVASTVGTVPLRQPAP